jgi:SH3-like domain-containing protein
MRPRVGRRIAGSLAVLLLALGACEGKGGEGADCPVGPKPKTPSGFCLPRYVSLKRGEVFGRSGPGRDYPVVFTYHARGLPVQVVDETIDWRRICDPDGGTVWISRAMTDGSRMVMAVGTDPIALRAQPSDTAAVTAWLRPRSVAALGAANGDWRQVTADGATGWLKTSEVWGLAAPAQCH